MSGNTITATVRAAGLLLAELGQRLERRQCFETVLQSVIREAHVADKARSEFACLLIEVASNRLVDL